MRRALAVVACLLATGCTTEPADVYLYPVTRAPPAATAQIDTEPDAITMTSGVALAIRCWDSCDEPDRGGCSNAVLFADDGAILKVRSVYDGANADYVLVANAVGFSTLHVRTSCASKDLAVRVVPR